MNGNRHLAATCPNCGTSNQMPPRLETPIQCKKCKLTFRAPANLTPEPMLGRLIMKADLTTPEVFGWKVINKDKLKFKPGLGYVPEMVATFASDEYFNAVMRTYSMFDDFDIAVTLRFLEGKRNYCHAGLEIRNSDDGDYVVSISPNDSFRIGSHEKADWGGTLSPWLAHPALYNQWGDANRLRVIAKGDRIRVYINGMFAASIRDNRFKAGFIRIVMVPKQLKTVVAFSEIELREVPKER